MPDVAETASDRARALHAENPDLNYVEIAAAAGCNPGTVWKAIRRQGRPQRTRITLAPLKNGRWTVRVNDHEWSAHRTRERAEAEVEWLRWPKP